MPVTWNDRMLDRDVYILWQFFLKAHLYDYNLNHKCCWSKIVVCCYSYAERNETERRAAASTCRKRLRITAKQFDLFENAMVWS